MDNRENELVILDCTIRDGSYAIDFKFTEADTRLLTQQLADLGFKWIEVGHGLGLGAMEAGKGNMPAGDIEMIRAAKSACGNSKIGMFFIPDIGKSKHLMMAKDAGLDFIRIGTNATEIEKSYPYLAEARKLGFLTCLNIMKSYAITPEEFAVKAQEAVASGAEIIYCVDSSGSMLPDGVARYFDAVRQKVNCKLGFHGHNNLMMVIANCITAYEHGARYLDASLCGLGRSAGNAPAEVLIAVFERMGISTGIDLFRVMDVIDTYMWPLVGQRRPHDMMAVTFGYSQFHSSFMPNVAAAARKYNVELRRLVAKLAFHDPVRVEDDFLEKTARQLSNTKNSRVSHALLSFHSAEISPKRISNSPDAVRSLIEGLVVAGTKRAGTRIVLQLVPSETPMEGLILPEFVLSDSQMVMGRVTFGSLDILRSVLDIAGADIFMFLVNQKQGWANDTPRLVAERVGAERMLVIRDEELRKQFLMQMLNLFAQRLGRDALLVYSPFPLVLQAMESDCNFDTIFLFGAGQLLHSTAKRIVVLRDWNEWFSLKQGFNAVLCCAEPTDTDIEVMLRSLAPEGKIISLLSVANILLQEIVDGRLIHLDLNLAYSGILARYLAAKSVFGAADHLEGY